MATRRSNPTRWAWFSPWIIIGSVCILAAILLVLAIKNVHREKETMVRTLLSQASILMRSLEAGSRTGMMGMGWGRSQQQMLMEQIAQQPDVLYVAIVTQVGTVIAHSDSSQVGKTLPVPIPQPGQTLHRFLEKEPKSFEVVHAYEPWSKQRGWGGRNRWAGGDDCPWPASSDSDRDLFMLVRLDPSSYEEALSQDLHQTIFLFGIMLLVGGAGFVSLMWAQNYRVARRSLQDIQAFTSTIVNQMPVGLIATDERGDIQSANEAAKSILYSTNLHGKIDQFPCFLPIARRLESHETVVDQEMQFKVDAAGSIPLLVNAAVIRDGERRIAGYAYLFTDMTNIRQLEEQLRRSERLASLGRLAAGVAHEIRNPLSSIKGFAAILGGRFKEDDRSQKIVEVMQQEVERVNRAVTELLDFARPTDLNKQPYSCQELIQRTLRLVESDALAQSVRIESTVHPADLLVQVDPDRFAQVLLNLYLNALQAMEKGGALRVEAFRKEGHVIINVTDSGAGIPPENLPHIFDPYFTTKPSGVGLGLANVHKLVEAHGGDIEVESQPGQGTSFTIQLASAS